MGAVSCIEKKNDTCRLKFQLTHISGPQSQRPASQPATKRCCCCCIIMYTPMYECNAHSNIKLSRSVSSRGHMLRHRTLCEPPSALYFICTASVLKDLYFNHMMTPPGLLPLGLGALPACSSRLGHRWRTCTAQSIGIAHGMAHAADTHVLRSGTPARQTTHGVTTHHTVPPAPKAP